MRTSAPSLAASRRCVNRTGFVRKPTLLKPGGYPLNTKPHAAGNRTHRINNSSGPEPQAVPPEEITKDTGGSADGDILTKRQKALGLVNAAVEPVREDLRDLRRVQREQKDADEAHFKYLAAKVEKLEATVEKQEAWQRVAAITSGLLAVAVLATCLPQHLTFSGSDLGRVTSRPQPPSSGSVATTQAAPSPTTPLNEAPLYDGDVNRRDAEGLTPLHLASRQGDLGRVRSLLAAGADIEARGRSNYSPTEPQGGFTPLLLASQGGHTAVVEELLGAGADKEARSQYGWTPLYVASRQGRTEVVRALLRAGAHVDATVAGWTPLHVASWRGHPEVTRHLLRAGANIEARAWPGLFKRGYTPLVLACIKGHLPVVQELLAAGADYNARTPDGWGAVNVANRFEHPEVAAYLLKYGTQR